jgi:hypothetical protein
MQGFLGSSGEDQAAAAGRVIMARYKVSELSGALLDSAVAKAEGNSLTERDGVLQPTFGQKYATDWENGGEIIERERLTTGYSDGTNKYRQMEGFSEEQEAYAQYQNHPHHFMVGRTVLIAAMRCYIAAKLGDEVELP